jgi:arylsulfatase A-like enzyme
MLTGQYPRTTGSWNNGIALRHDSPTVANVLHDAGMRTGLIGKAHFEPYSAKHSLETVELGMHNRFAPFRGFDYYIGAGHDQVPVGGHYTQWIKRYYPQYLEGDDYLYNLLILPTKPGEVSKMNISEGGETGAVFVKKNLMPRELYHTDWTADHAINYMDSIDDEEDCFVWVSFPDPHHPYDPPSSEDHRCGWEDVPPVPGHGESDEQRLEWLGRKPWHWEHWYRGDKFVSFEALQGYSYQKSLGSDNVREIRAKIAISNEIIDEAIGRLIKYLEDRGWLDDTHIIFTPDHGGMDGDYGLLLIGPDLTNHCSKLSMIWKPAKNANVPAADVEAPVGIVDLAPTFCKIAGVEVPDWMEGRPLPVSQKEAEKQNRQVVFTQYESHTPDADIILNAARDERYTCIQYERTQTYQGTEGELYDRENDPMELENLWDDPAHQGIKEDLIAEIKNDLLNRDLFHPMPEPGALI